MAKSILQTKSQALQCWNCETYYNLEEHHVFSGPNRNNSEHYGLKVKLCPYCHRGTEGVHNNAELSNRLKMYAQQIFEKKHSHEEFMNVFGKNYL